MRQCPNQIGLWAKWVHFALGGFQLTVGVSTPRLMVLYSVREQAEQTKGIKAGSKAIASAPASSSCPNLPQ